MPRFGSIPEFVYCGQVSTNETSYTTNDKPTIESHKDQTSSNDTHIDSNDLSLDKKSKQKDDSSAVPYRRNHRFCERSIHSVSESPSRKSCTKLGERYDDGRGNLNLVKHNYRNELSLGHKCNEKDDRSAVTDRQNDRFYDRSKNTVGELPSCPSRARLGERYKDGDRSRGHNHAQQNSGGRTNKKFRQHSEIYGPNKRQRRNWTPGPQRNGPYRRGNDRIGLNRYLPPDARREQMHRKGWTGHSSSWRNEKRRWNPPRESWGQQGFRRHRGRHAPFHQSTQKGCPYRPSHNRNYR